VLFLVATVFIFSPLNFILFVCGSLFFSLILHMLLCLNKKYDKRVPLMGFQSLLLNILVIIDLVTSNIGFYNDSLFFALYS
jgi:uncharacterized membrane protein